MNRERWWVTNAATLAGPVMFVGTILVFVLLAAAGDAPVFALTFVIGLGAVLAFRRRRRRDGA